MAFWAAVKSSVFQVKLVRLHFGQLLEKVGYFLFQHLVTLVKLARNLEITLELRIVFTLSHSKLLQTHDQMSRMLLLAFTVLYIDAISVKRMMTIILKRPGLAHLKKL